MTKFLIQAAVAVAVVTALGCADPEPRVALPDLPKCNQKGNNKDCRVPVLVAESNGACTVKVDPSLSEIAFPRGQVDKHIYWEIDGPAGYGFTPDGIAIEKNIPRDFDKPKVLDKGRVFRWKNLHKVAEPKVYYYTVNVTNGDGSITCSQDPKIHNE
jgi:hypothetical protein